MSIDTEILAFDTKNVTPRIVEVALNDYRTAEQSFEDTERWVDFSISSAAFLQEWYDELTPPPALNNPSDPTSLAEYFFKVSWFKSPSMRPPIYFRQGYMGKSNIILSGRLFEEFLEPRTERGHNLWTKFTGSTYEGAEWNDREWVPLCIGDTDYRIETQSLHRAGFIQGEELAALAEELESIQSELPEFYESLDEPSYRRCDAVEGHAIELVTHLCRTLSLYSSESVVLGYHWW